MLFTQQVFHFECLIFFCWYLKLLLIWFKCQQNEKLTLPHEFIFVLICCFTGEYCRKSPAKSGRSGKIYKKGGMTILGGVQTFCTLCTLKKGNSYFKYHTGSASVCTFSFALTISLILKQKRYPSDTMFIDCRKTVNHLKKILGSSYANNIFSNVFSWDHSFSTYSKFSVKLLLLTPCYAHLRAHIRR